MLAVLISWRYLRHPDRNSETGRVVIGWAALSIGVLGLVHIANGTPAPSDGAVAMRHAGGLVGFAASAPLAKVLTAWVAAPILALLAGFGILVITGTPVHRIPERMEEARVFFGRRTRVLGDGEDYGEELARTARRAANSRAAASGSAASSPGPARGARAAIEGGDRIKPYDSPVLTPDKRARPRAPGRPRRRPRRRRPGARARGRPPARKPTRGCSRRSASCRARRAPPPATIPVTVPRPGTPGPCRPRPSR